MVDVPHEVRLRVFPGLLARGVVFRFMNYPLLTTGPRDKFLVLLNTRFYEGCEIHHVLTTSQVADLPFRDLALIVPAGTLAFLRLDTAIPCRQVYSMLYEELAEAYANNRLERVGELTPELLRELDTVLERARFYFPSRVTNAILPPRTG